MERLERFLTDTADDSAEHVALRALTLHMLEGVAPRFFTEHRLRPTLQQALEACRHVDAGLDSEDADRLQAGIDCWYLCHHHGLPHQPPDALALRSALESLAQADAHLYAWLLGELAVRAGLDVRLQFSPTQFDAPPLVQGYYLTHLVLLDTDYFARPVRHPDAATWAGKLADLVGWANAMRNFDLLGELGLCLSVLKHPKATEVRSLLAHARVRPDTHEQATVLLALVAE